MEKDVQCSAGRRSRCWRRSGGFLFGRRRRRRFKILNVPPRKAFRRLATTAARAFRIPERQSHLEREIRAQKVRKISAVGMKDESHLVFAQTQMVEQDVARPVAYHFMQRL